MSNYPIGAENDSSAPWNRPQPKDCPTCDGVGKVELSDCCGVISYDNICQLCNMPCETELDICSDCNGEGVEMEDEL